MHARTEGRYLALNRVKIFNHTRYPFEWPWIRLAFCVRFFGFTRLLERTLEEGIRKRVDACTDGLSPSDHGLHQLHRRQSFCAKRRDSFGRTHITELSFFGHIGNLPRILSPLILA